MENLNEIIKKKTILRLHENYRPGIYEELDNFLENNSVFKVDQNTKYFSLINKSKLIVFNDISSGFLNNLGIDCLRTLKNIVKDFRLKYFCILIYINTNFENFLKVSNSLHVDSTEFVIKIGLYNFIQVLQKKKLFLNLKFFLFKSIVRICSCTFDDLHLLQLNFLSFAKKIFSFNYS